VNDTSHPFEGPVALLAARGDSRKGCEAALKYMFRDTKGGNRSMGNKKALLATALLSLANQAIVPTAYAQIPPSGLPPILSRCTKSDLTDTWISVNCINDAYVRHLLCENWLGIGNRSDTVKLICQGQ
jgi:hypothetical protein